MNASEILEKVKKVEVKTRGLSQNILAGQYHITFKRYGMAFSEVRGYQSSDDVRDTDWNITARSNRPYIKVFEKEHELTVMLLTDVSGSLDFGTKKQAKRETTTETAATLVFSAIQNNDRIGAIFFLDRIEKYILPKKGRKHILYIIHEMLDFDPESKKTNIVVTIEYLTRMIKRRCMACVSSDFYIRHDAREYDRSEHVMNIVNHKHNMIAVQIYDPRTKNLSNIGLIKICDAEAGHKMIIGTSSAKLRRAHAACWMERNAQLKQTFVRSGVDWTSAATDENYARAMMQLFAQRGVQQACPWWASHLSDV